MTIEPATARDLDAITDIDRHSFPRPWPRATFEAELARDCGRLIVARAPTGGTLLLGICPLPGADGRAIDRRRAQRHGVLGFCNYWIVADEVHILAIATHPDHRRAGIAGALLAHALAEGHAANCRLATLEVRRSNAPAIALYERAGFRTVHVRAGYYGDDGSDALVMLKT